MGEPAGDVEAAAAVDGDLGGVDGDVVGGPVVGRAFERAVARRGRDGAAPIYFAEALVALVADVEITVGGIDGEPARSAEAGFGGRPPSPEKPR